MKCLYEHTPKWADQFATIATWLEKRIPEYCRIHHIGSTSGFGVPAKDVIDIDIECPLGSMERVITALKIAGYENEGDRGIPGREAFHPKEESEASNLYPHHLYACESNSKEMHRRLAFRNYLLANPEKAKWLAEHKIECDKMAQQK